MHMYTGIVSAYVCMHECVYVCRLVVDLRNLPSSSTLLFEAVCLSQAQSLLIQPVSLARLLLESSINSF